MDLELQLKKLSAVRRAAREAKPLLERKYSLRIGGSAFTWAVDYGLGFFGVPGGPSLAKVVEILEESCKLRAEKFKNFEFGRALDDKAYDLFWSLVEYKELYRDIYPESRSWLAVAVRQREYASNFITTFLERWDHVLMPSLERPPIWTPEMVEELCALYHKVSEVAARAPDERSRDLVPSFIKVAREIDHLLDTMMEKLFQEFRPLLSVYVCDVAETVSKLYDIPATQLSNPETKPMIEHGRLEMKKRFIQMDRVIDEIFNAVVSRKHGTMRPRASILLLGPHGVGKTGIAMAFAKHFYCDVSRLIQVDMADYAEPQSEASPCGLREWSNRKQCDLLHSLAAAVRRCPYSVIVLDHIEKACPSITQALFEVLTSDAPCDPEGNKVDFSNSIIFMTSRLGSDHLAMLPKCCSENKHGSFYKTHDCSQKVVYSKRAFEEALILFGADRLKSLDKVLIVEKFRSSKIVARTLLREIVEEKFGRGMVVYLSDAALEAIAVRASDLDPFGAGTAIKNALHEQIISHLLAAKVQKGVVFVDTLAGTHTLSFRYQIHEQLVDAWIFKQQEGKLGRKIADFRIKLQSAYSFFELRRNCSLLLENCGLNDLPHQLEKNLADISNLVSMFLPCPDLPPKHALDESASFKLSRNCLLTVEEKEQMKNQMGGFQKNASGPDKAICAVLDAVIKISDTSSQPLEVPIRFYLFASLDNDCKMSLINGLTESLQTGDGKLFFTYIKFDENSDAESLRKFIIKEVELQSYTVFMFDGIEFADASVYGFLLEIFDNGNLVDDQGDCIDFRNSVIIIVSEAGNDWIISRLFRHSTSDLAMQQSTTRRQNLDVRFRTELLYRVEEIIFFDPLLGEKGDIIRFSMRGQHQKPGYISVLPSLIFKMFEPSPEDGMSCDKAANCAKARTDGGSNIVEGRSVAEQKL